MYIHTNPSIPLYSRGHNERTSTVNTKQRARARALSLPTIIFQLQPPTTPPPRAFQLPHTPRPMENNYRNHYATGRPGC